MDLLPLTPREKGYFAATLGNARTGYTEFAEPDAQRLWQEGYDEAKKDSPEVQHRKLEAFERYHDSTSS